MVHRNNGASTVQNENNSGKPLSRELSTIEHLLHKWHDDNGGACTAAAFARVQGIPDRTRMAANLRWLQEQDPLLNVVVNGSMRAPRFERPPRPAPIPLAWVTVTDPLAWKRRLIELAATAFDVTTGPLIRVEILENSQAGHADILIHAHHSICDGQSMLALYRCLLNQTDEVGKSRTDEHWLTTPLTFRKHPRWKSWAGLWSIILRRRRAHRREMGRLPGQPSDSVTVCHRSLSREATSKLVGDCRRESTTVYGALAAAIQLTLARRYRLFDQPLSVQSLVNTRDWYRPLPSSEEFGCYVGTVMTWQVLEAASRFWDVARECRDQVTKYLQQNGPDWSNRLLSGALRRNMPLNREPAICVINSVGVVPEVAEARSLPLTELGWISNLDGTGIPLGFVGLTVGGRLQITSQSRWLTPDDMESLLAEVEQLLSSPSATR